MRWILMLTIIFLATPGNTAPRTPPDRMILCPTQKISGCDVTVDPLGKPAQPVMCQASHCRVGRPKIVDGRKVCSFSCPNYIVP